jgi:peptidoglycan/LPS O-acetylase OafA/YrhL
VSGLRRDDDGRVVAIDLAKGVAILWVLLIHAQVLAGRVVMRDLINHAVPVFLVLFGLNAEQWWRQRTAADLALWYRRYLRRILVPVWGMLPVWWVSSLWLRPDQVQLSWGMMAANALGYLPNIGAGWFVTIIVYMVLVFPLLHFAARRVGSVMVLAGGLVCLVAAVAFQVPLWWRLGPFNQLTFAPRMFGHVTFGLFLASRLDRLTVPAGLVALALWGFLSAAVQATATSPVSAYPERLMDLPLTVSLLVLMNHLAGLPWVARPIGWLGVNSYGLYIGQVLVHNLVYAWFGVRGPWRLVGHWTYALLLFLATLVTLALGNGLVAAARWAGGTISGAVFGARAARAPASDAPSPPGR